MSGRSSKPNDPAAAPSSHRAGRTRGAQLLLDVRLRESATFASFISQADGAARQAVERIATGPEPGAAFLWGTPGTGKTHLLHAACRAAGADGAASACIGLASAVELAPALLEDLGALDLVCLDDVQVAAGRPQWERALFHLHNEVAAAGGRLLLAATSSPNRCRFALPDLASRLAGGLVLRLRGPTDAERIAVLRARARTRGFTLPERVAEYALRRMDRDMHSLMAFLDALDAGSLAEKRRITIPFVRGLLGARD